MSLVRVSKVTKAFGGAPVLDGVSFQLGHQAKVGLVGENGSGKSTVLKLIAGTLQPDAGEVRVARSARLWHVPQTPDLRPGRTAHEEVLTARPQLFQLRQGMLRLERRLAEHPGEADSVAYAAAVAEFSEAGGYAFERDAREALHALGLGEEQIALQVDRLSGGEQSRVALARALLADASLLLLDEPDNHLDIEGITWLEGMLSRHRGALMLVTHDRELLDRVVGSIIEIEDAKVTHESGSFASYLQRKRDRIQRQKRDYLEQQRRVRRLHRAMTRVGGKARAIEAATKGDHLRRVARMIARKAKTLKKRIHKQLEGEEKIEKPREDRERIRVDLTPRKWHARTVLRLEGIAKAFGGRTLFRGVTLELARGERVALVGPNGSGKTTLMEIALGRQEPDAGAVWLSQGAQSFYCDQHQGGLTPGLSAYETLATNTELNENQRHYLLAKLLFTGEALHRKVEHLSGGERTRLVLALLMNTRADALLLDEPTNHLDLPSIEVLQEALSGFPGAVLLITHDRRLVRAVATDVLELRGGRLLRRGAAAP